MNMKNIFLMTVPAAGWFEEYGAILLIIALVMSLVSLVLVIRRYVKGNQKKRPGPATDVDPTNPFLGGLTERMRQEVKDLIKQEKSSQALAESFRRTPVVATPLETEQTGSQINVLNEEQGPVTVDLSVENRLPSPAAGPAKGFQRLYAKFPADAHRFSGEMLVPDQDGEQVYELDIHGDVATYRVSENEAVQKYALSEDKYLLACAYDEIPVNRNVTIVNNGTGRLSRSGADWHIDDKVRINFV